MLKKSPQLLIKPFFPRQGYSEAYPNGTIIVKINILF